MSPPNVAAVAAGAAVLLVAAPARVGPRRRNRSTLRAGRAIGAAGGLALDRVGPLAARAASGVGRSLGAVVGIELESRTAAGVGAALLAGAAAGLLHPALGLAIGAAVLAAPARVAAARRERHATRVRAETPELVDLFRLAVGAGLTVPLAVAAVAPRARGITGAALARVPERVALGERLADALVPLGRCGPGAAALVAALVAGERDGVALGPTLERLARQSRDDRRHRAQERARRLPVLLVFPLVLCILPAFVLLTVVPLLVGVLPNLTG